MIDIEKVPEFDNHETVLRFYDKATELRGYIAIHNTSAGPAVGGTRYWHYGSEKDALRDALRLSKAMTYKCALANVPYGGGKAVLMAPRSHKGTKDEKSEKYLAAYAKRLAALDGHFFTGEDVGMTEKDIEILARYSPSIIGRPSVGGLPSPWAAKSVLQSMRAALKVLYGSDSFTGRTIAIKGLGNVGFDLALMLREAGAVVIASEIRPERVQRAKKEIPQIKIVAPEVIHKQKADVFSPCALGGDLTQQSIRELKAKIICGSANNQLASSKDSSRLFKRGIIYVPDYVANAGGLINVVDELHSGGYDRARVERNVAQVFETVTHLLTESIKKKRPSDFIADQIVAKRLTSVKT